MNTKRLLLFAALAGAALAAWRSLPSADAFTPPPGDNNWVIQEKCVPPTADLWTQGMTNCHRGAFSVAMGWTNVVKGKRTTIWRNTVTSQVVTNETDVDYVPFVTWANTSSLRTVDMSGTGSVARFMIDPKSFGATNNAGHIQFKLEFALNCPPAIITNAVFAGVHVDLDVTNDTLLGHEDDGVANYLPGYVGNRTKGYAPVLSKGKTYLDPQYEGQAMTLVLHGIGRDAGVDEVIFEIVDSTSYDGYCENATHDTIVSDNAKKDYSFKRTEDADSIQLTLTSSPEGPEYGGRIEADRAWARFWCKDYGGRCRVRVTVKSGGNTLFTCGPRTIPADTKVQGIADIYLEMQEQEWSNVYTWTNAPPWPASLHRDYDREPLDPDNRTTCPVDNNSTNGVHSTLGDGLKAFEEYRGFILDYGPGHTGGHRRLSIARRDLLIMTAVMDGIPQSISAGENPGAGGASYYEDMRSVVTAFYCDQQRGAGIDLYWVRVPMDMGGEIKAFKLDAQNNPVLDSNGQPVEYEGNRPHAYDWTKPVYRTGSTNAVSGGAYIYEDLLLKHHDVNLYEKYFIPPNAGPNINAADMFCRRMNDTGGPELKLFIKVGIISRLAYNLRRNDFTCKALLAGQPNWANIYTSLIPDQGACLSVAAIAEEGPHQNYSQNQHYNQQEFENIYHWVAAHEIMHLLLLSIPGDPWQHPAQYLANSQQALMGLHPGITGISTVYCENISRNYIDMHTKDSVPATAPSQP